MTTDPRTMTTEQLRDWLAVNGDAKWCPTRCRGFTQWERPDGTHADGEPRTHIQGNHPIPDTLDAAAGAMPEGWGYLVNRHLLNDKPNVYCEAVYLNGMPCPLARVRAEADTEKHARLLLAVLCRMAGKGDSK